jgi:hypothetical protein
MPDTLTPSEAMIEALARNRELRNHTEHYFDGSTAGDVNDYRQMRLAEAREDLTAALQTDRKARLEQAARAMWSAVSDTPYDEPVSPRGRST